MSQPPKHQLGENGGTRQIPGRYSCFLGEQCRSSFAGRIHTWVRRWTSLQQDLHPLCRNRGGNWNRRTREVASYTVKWTIGHAWSRRWYQLSLFSVENSTRRTRTWQCRRQWCYLTANAKMLRVKVAGKSIDRTWNDPCVNWLSGLNCMVWQDITYILILFLPNSHIYVLLQFIFTYIQL